MKLDTFINDIESQLTASMSTVVHTNQTIFASVAVVGRLVQNTSRHSLCCDHLLLLLAARTHQDHSLACVQGREGEHHQENRRWPLHHHLHLHLLKLSVKEDA